MVAGTVNVGSRIREDSNEVSKVIVGEMPEHIAFVAHVVPELPPKLSALIVKVTTSPLLPEVNWKLVAKLNTPTAKADVPMVGPLIMLAPVAFVNEVIFPTKSRSRLAFMSLAFTTMLAPPPGKSEVMLALAVEAGVVMSSCVEVTSTTSLFPDVED